MKKLFTLVTIFTLVLASCGEGDGGNTGGTTLEIKNESAYEITHVLWNNVSFTNNQIENSIKPGTSVSMTVQAGSGYIRFRPKLNPFNTRTEMVIVVEKNERKEFVFLNNTVVVNESNSSTDTLATFAASSFSGKVGNSGPGGGTIFFAQGGQYKECSGEMGSYNWNDAIMTAQNYRGGGFNDWYLPDRGEVDLMYENLHSKGLGGFTSNAYYWSSTSDGDSWAYRKTFNSSGPWGSFSKTNSYRVRAVRSFSIY